MSDFKHVGTVEVLRTRLYSLDPNNHEPTATEVIVEPGHYPLMFDGYSHVWIMNGVLNGQFLRRGDGLFVAAKEANAIPTNIHVTFPSMLFGPDDWEELLKSPACREGHDLHRLRITEFKEEV